MGMRSTRCWCRPIDVSSRRLDPRSNGVDLRLDCVRFVVDLFNGPDITSHIPHPTHSSQAHSQAEPDHGGTTGPVLHCQGVSRGMGCFDRFKGQGKAAVVPDGDGCRGLPIRTHNISHQSTDRLDPPPQHRELRGKVEFIQQRHDKFGRALKTPGATAADPAVKDLYTCESVLCVP